MPIQRRQQIADAIERLEAAANAWRVWEAKSADRLSAAIDALRKARNPPLPADLKRAMKIETALQQKLEEIKANLKASRQVVDYLFNNAATPEQLAQIEKWEREIEEKE